MRFAVLLSALFLAQVKAGAGDAYSHVAPPEYREVPADEGSEVLVLGPDGRAATGKFHVSETQSAKVFGQMDAADAKFVRAASSATLSVADGRAELVVDCPVPAGMKTKKQMDLWSGDFVVVSVRPDPADPLRICYCVNATGARSAGVFGRPCEGWKTGAKLGKTDIPGGYRVTVNAPVAEFFGCDPKPGATFGLNVTRRGPTCGGHSAWAKAGGLYNDATSAYGTVIYGGAGKFFRERLVAVRTRNEARTGDGAARQAVARVCHPVEEAIAAHAGEAAAFASLERMFADLDKALLTIELKGNPLLVYVPDDIWGNTPEPKSGVKPLERIRIRTPRNARSVRAFAVANFSKDMFVGNLKFFDRFDRRCRDGFYRSGTQKPLPPGVARHLTVRRALEVRGSDGRPLFDPLVELPLGTTLEVAPGKVAPLFAELDTHGVAAGSYTGLLILRSAIPGFPETRIDMEVTVTDDDLDVVNSDKAGGTHLATSFGAGGCPVTRPAVNCVRQLAQRGYNVVLLSRIDDMYPVRDAKGEWQRPSYVVLDAYVDAWLAGGVDPKRIKLWPYIGVEREKPLWKGLRDHAGKRIPFGTPEYDDGLRCMVGFFVEHVGARYGIGRDRIIWKPTDEAIGDVDDPTFASSASRALHAARVIKGENASNVVFWNPRADAFLRTKDADVLRHALRPDRMGICDVISLYRPKLSDAAIGIVQQSGQKTVWAYHISTKNSSPAKYRSPIWKNLRDGFTETVSFWHLDESAVLDNSRAHPYGSCYVDWDNDALILSRRQLAADMAAEEGRLVRYLREKTKGDSARFERVNALVKEASDDGGMAAMDDALEQLLELL